MSFRQSLDWDCLSNSHDRSVKVVAILSASIATIYGLNVIRQKLSRSRKVEKKRKDCSDSKNRLQKHLDETKEQDGAPEEITCLSFEDLQKKLQNGELSPVTVMRAYQRKALGVDRRLNCLIEPITEAEEWAKDCKRGPLYGVPISLKDIMPIQGYGLTLGGCANLLGMIHPVDAAFITVLKNQGAIPFGITNAPQTLLSFSTTNPVFGFTGNPHDPTRTPGGSSGGEAALIGGGGSILGVGSDLGGSVRVPAAFCGICSLKPTQERCSHLGFMPIVQRLVAPCNGPMARDVHTLVEYMRAVSLPELFELDPVATPVPFRDEIYLGSKPLRIGYYCDDGYYPAIPAYHRAVHMVKQVLERRGHTVVPFQIPDVGYAIEELGIPAVLGDGGEMLKFVLAGDKISHDLIIPFWVLHFPKEARRLIGWLWGFLDRTQGAIVRGTCGKSSVSEWWNLSGALQVYRTRVIAEWHKKKIDCVICPPCASVALPDRVTGKLGAFYSYTFLYNVLNFPAGVVPVTRVSSDDVARLADYWPQTHGQRILKKAMVGSEGLPVGVQCVGLPYQEELVLRLMKAVEAGLRET